MRYLVILISFVIIPTTTFSENTNNQKVNQNSFSYDLALRERFENTDWVNDSNQAYGHTKVQAGFGYQYSLFKAYAQAQYSGIYGLNDNAQGLASNYFNQNNKDDDSHHVFLRQGYLQLTPDFHRANITLGRFLYSSGAELAVKNKELQWLQKNRLADRIIGAFDFTFGRSFDGIKTSIDGFGLNYFRPTSGGLYTDGMRHINEVGVLAATYSRNIEYAAQPGQIQVFYYNYDDSRSGITKVDNRESEVIKLDQNNININTFGFHHAQLYKLDHLVFDLVLWGAAQYGDWGNQDHLAASFVAETGVKFESTPWTPWLRGGWNWGSGDSNASDGKHNTFFQMLPTVRVYALTPYFTMMNTHDLFVQAIAQPTEKLTLRADTHALFLSSRNDLLYSGAGVGKENLFGYAGKNSGDNSYIGTLLDLSIGYSFNKNLIFNTYYGHLFGGDVQGTSDKNIDYFFFEFVVKS